MMTSRQNNGRIYRWALKLSEFHFEIVYRAGKKNGVADCLSRCFGDGSDDVTEFVSGTPVFLEEGGDVGLRTHMI